MAYAQELKNLVAEIKTSHRDRTAYVKDIKDTTHELIARFRKELQEMAKDLKDFLAKSEETRKKDFDAFYKAIRARVKDVKADTAKLMTAIRARIKDIKGDTADLLARYDKEMKELAVDLKDFLKKSEATRMADFKAMMGDIATDIDAITKTVGTLLADYRTERKEAARFWAGLTAKKAAEEAASAAEAAPKKKREEEKRRNK